jgi:hypothetical protein
VGGSRTGRAGNASRLRRVIEGGLASALAVVGLVAFATPAFAHDNIVSASASCASPLGTGFQIVWTIENDFNLPETGSVTSITGGLSTLNSTTYSVAASPGQPFSSTTLTQTLPATASGVITIDISSSWTDGFTVTSTGSYDLSQLSCGAPSQTIAGHIYLCASGNPTTTEESGGTLAASGPTTVAGTPNPLAPTPVGAGTYTMTATAPPGFQLVTCGGSSTPNSSGSSATTPVTVPSGGAGVGIFYVAAITQTIAGHIYLCASGNPTTTEESGGTLAASGPTTVAGTPNPLAPTPVGAGTYTMTATAPPGFQLVTCGGSSTPNSSGSSATTPVTVPSGGAGVGIFYVAASAGVVTNPTATIPTTSAGTTPPPSAATTAATPATTPSATPTSVVTSPLAVTGASVSGEWSVGLTLLLLGGTALLTARWHRKPKEARK